MALGYDLDKLKLAAGEPMWSRAVTLYEGGKVTHYKEDAFGASAIVRGGSPYRVFVSRRRFDDGDCDCYLGQKDELCKHMLAVAIFAVQRGKPLTDEDKRLVSAPTASGRVGPLTPEERAQAADAIRSAMKCIKSYSGPSRTWFA